MNEDVDCLGQVILLVDDDDAVCRLVRLFLENSGYAVVEARTAAEALLFARQKPVALLLSDVVMPGIDGVTLANRFHCLQPAAGVLLMTGFTPLRMVLEADWEIIRKPFVSEELVSKINHVLQPHQLPA